MSFTYKTFFEQHIQKFTFNKEGQAVGVCPFHDDHNPSFSCNLKDGLWFCHGCGEKGNIDQFYERLGLPIPTNDNIQDLQEIAVYTYEDEAGNSLFQVRKYHPKTFRQFRPDGKGGWIAGLNGISPTLYKWPEISKSHEAWVSEGEKDVETLREWGFVATTNPHGACKWKDSYSDLLKNKDIVIIGDTDAIGQQHVRLVALSLWGKAQSIKVIKVPNGKDVSAWKGYGGTPGELKQLVGSTPPLTKDDLLRYQIEVEKFKHPSSTSLNNIEVVNQISPTELCTLTEPEPRIDIVEGLIPEGMISLLFADGGQCKSYLALFLATYLALGMDFIGLKTKKINVLFMDWELDQNEHTRRAYRIARGLNLSQPPPGLFYYRAEQALSKIQAVIKEFVLKHNIGLIIIDAFGAACSGNPESAESVIPVMSEHLRSINTTVLLLDHQSKLQEGQSYDKKTPFGSVYKFNLARSVIQSQKVRHEPGELCLLLKPTKFNLSYIPESIPLRLKFEENKVTLEKGNSEIETYFKEPQRVGTRILDKLKELGSATKAELAEYLKMPPGTIGNQITYLKKKKLIQKVGRKGKSPLYGLTSTISSSKEGSEKMEQLKLLSSESNEKELENE